MPAAVHPRVRGAHVEDWRSPLVRRGSSPRPRGTPQERQVDARRRRFIPASAGHTRSGRWRPRSWPVHPRVRGAHYASPAEALLAHGSSPRPRGTHHPHPRPRQHARFIPASAGHTWNSPLDTLSWPVHPRVRGAHIEARRLLPSASGSSPRPRGTPRLSSSYRRKRRFIPASAGHTCPRRRGGASNSVHPRVRGAHLVGLDHEAVRPGSSPRPRGTLLRGPGGLSNGRFIPASTGHTPPRLFVCSSSTVHPRVRGAHVRRGLRG